MNDSEFIQLLNLYLDHEISDADAIRLEAEVQNNPVRRRLYRNYCQMQKACRMLAADFATEAAAPATGKVVPFNPAARTSHATRLYTVGGFAAAAACLAIILVGHNRQPANALAQEPAAQPVVAQVTPIESVAPAAGDANVTLVAAGSAAVQPARTERLQTTLVADPLLLTRTTRVEATLTNSVQQASDQFEWITALQLPPLQPRTSIEQLRFNTTPAPLRPEGGRALGNRSRISGNTAPAEEMSAFEFRR